MITSTSTESMETETELNLNPWPHLSDYFVFQSRLGEHKLIYECKLCLPKVCTIKAHVSSLNNLKQHMKRTHASKYVQFEEKVKVGSTRGRRKKTDLKSVNSLDVDSSRSDLFSLLPVHKRLRQQSIGESFGIAAAGSGVTQASVDQCIVNFFVANMIPLHVVETDTFEKLIKTLNPSKNTISRRTLGRRIIDSHAQLKQYLIK